MRDVSICSSGTKASSFEAMQPATVKGAQLIATSLSRAMNESSSLPADGIIK